MDDLFIKQTVSNILDVDQDLYWKEPELFLKDTNIGMLVIEELVIRDYKIEITGSYPDFVVVVSKWFMAGQDDDDDKYEYAYSRGNNIIKALMEVLVKVHRHE